jgi:lipopolysaccharide exporter
MNYTISSIGDLFKDGFNGRSLLMRVARGSAWIGAADFTTNFCRFFRNAVLTRILAPDAFGILAIIQAIIATMESLTQIGLSDAIIQNSNSHDNEFINRAWWLSFLRCSVIYSIMFISAPLISEFYKNSELEILLKISFLSVVFSGLISPKAYLEIKKMNFKTWVIINHGGALLGICTAIITAIFVRNVFALIIGLTSEALARCILSYIFCPFCPSIPQKNYSSKSLSKYIRGYFGLPIMALVYNQIDIFLIGKVCSSEELGLYNMALTLAQMPAVIAVTILGNVGMSAFSEIQDDKPRLCKAITGVTSVALAIGVPLAYYAMIFGKDLLSVIYGSIYGSISIPFAFLILRTMIQIMGAPIVTLFNAIGKPNISRNFATLRAIVLILIAYPAISLYGLLGASVSGLVAMFISYLFLIYNLRKVLLIDLKNYFSIYLKSSIVSFIIPIIWLLIYNIDNFPISKILVGLIGVIFVYVFMARNIFCKTDLK